MKPRLLRWVKLLGLAEDVFLPPLCECCGRRRWGNAPLCLVCLKRLARNRLDAPQTHLGDATLNEGQYPAGEHAFTCFRALFRLTPELSSLIHGLKYRGYARHAHFLAGYLRLIPEAMAFVRLFDQIVPVPLHSLRQRERGYNQSELLARRIGCLAGRPVMGGALKRTRYTETQTRLGAGERSRNLSGAFTCAKGPVVKGLKILLIDDVYTTGATCDACAQALLAAGAQSVGVLAVAEVIAGGQAAEPWRELALAGSFTF